MTRRIAVAACLLLASQPAFSSVFHGECGVGCYFVANNYEDGFPLIGTALPMPSPDVSSSNYATLDKYEVEVHQGGSEPSIDPWVFAYSPFTKDSYSNNPSLPGPQYGAVWAYMSAGNEFNGSATFFTYKSKPRQTLTFLWGSPGIEDTVTLGGLTFTGAQLRDAWGDDPDESLGTVAIQISFTASSYNSVIFGRTAAEGNGSFEFAMLEELVAPVPLPASGLLLLPALGGIFLVRRKAK